MHILNIGSVNIDHVYMVDHFVRPGETLSSAQHDTFAGGKGFNQSIALARAGAPTRHAGRVGQDAAWLLDRWDQIVKWVEGQIPRCFSKGIHCTSNLKMTKEMPAMVIFQADFVLSSVEPCEERDIGLGLTLPGRMSALTA